MTLTRLAFWLRTQELPWAALCLLIVFVGVHALLTCVHERPPYAPVVLYEYPGTISPSSLTSNQLIIGNGSVAITGTLPISNGAPGFAKDAKVKPQ